MMHLAASAETRAVNMDEEKVIIKSAQTAFVCILILIAS